LFTKFLISLTKAYETNTTDYTRTSPNDGAGFFQYVDVQKMITPEHPRMMAPVSSNM
jgi:hypothetical protein